MSIDQFLTEVIDVFRGLDVWDEAPTLALVCRVGGGPRLAGLLVLPESVWQYGPPRTVLRALASTVSEIGMPPLPATFEPVGVMLVSEGYGIDGEARPPGYWDTHRIADDPDGYEYVSAIAVDVDGAAYGHTYRRHDDQAHANAMTSGALVDGLRELLTAMLQGARS